MATGEVRSAAAQGHDVTELRLLVELAALRQLADRGLHGQELAVTQRLADATLPLPLRGSSTR
jgi:DNA-binding GntR family transcriptional regulator